MPNRILRDWTDSETIDKLSIDAERFFVRLIMKVDDYGRYTANFKMLKSSLFPLKTDIRETDIALWLTECEQCGLIALYNIAMRDYLQIKNFKQQLRQKNEKYPPPDNCLADDTQTLSRCEHETKRNEVETNSLGARGNLPEIQEVERVFVQQGGTKEMAKAFFNKHSATGWKINGQEIQNFSFLVPNCIAAWHEKRSSNGIHFPKAGDIYF